MCVGDSIRGELDNRERRSKHEEGNTLVMIEDQKLWLSKLRQLCLDIAHLGQYSRTVTATEIKHYSRAQWGKGELFIAFGELQSVGALCWNGRHKWSEVWLPRDWVERFEAWTPYRHPDLEWLWPELRAKRARRRSPSARPYSTYVFRREGESLQGYLLRILDDMGAEDRPVRVRQIVHRNTRLWSVVVVNRLLIQLDENNGPVIYDRDMKTAQLAADWMDRSGEWLKRD